MRALSFALLAALAVPAIGCTSDDKGPEEELAGLDDSSKADTQRQPTEHGALVWGAKSDAVLTADARFHAWTFALSGDASVDLKTTYTVAGQRRTDTVLYLYKQQASGAWGSYLARNDDYGSTTYSQLKRTLGAGTYRIIVKGHDATTVGKFSVVPACSGAGCTVIDPNACLFGDTYGDLLANPALAQISMTKYTPANFDQLSDYLKGLFVVAVHQSSHTDVVTPAEALAAVDQSEVNVSFYNDAAGRREYVAFEYGAGDNSYGGVFDFTSGVLASPIHDGDLYPCTARHETCLLDEDWLALRNDTAYETASTRVVTAAGDLSGVQATQALSALHQSYPDAATLAAALANADGGQLNVVTIVHKATGTRLEVFEYGAGDTSVGAIFFAGTTNRAGTIEDLFISGCAFFAAH